VLPLLDVNPTRRVPVLTIGLIAANVAVFLYQLQKPDNNSLSSQTAFQCRWGLVPDHLIHGGAGPMNPAGTTCQQLNAEHDRYLELFTSQFLHASWFHLLGNMLFLWVFGNNVEDRLGRIRFLPFYAVCGAIAGLTQSLVAPSEHFPLIGASGAIAGVLGAYIVLYPRAQVWTIIFPFFFLPFRVPAFIVLGLWFLFQFLYAGGQSQEGGGVAYWAHVGGFVAGAALIIPFLVGRRRPPPAPPKPEPVW
jgi:membrane associated rhomboid family serine protease